MALPVPIAGTRSALRDKHEDDDATVGNTRVCVRCRREKSERQFSVIKYRATKKHLKTYVHPWCNACKRDYNARWMRASRQKAAVLSPQFAGPATPPVKIGRTGNSGPGPSSENRLPKTPYSQLSTYSYRFAACGPFRASLTLFYDSRVPETSPKYGIK